MNIRTYNPVIQACENLEIRDALMEDMRIQTIKPNNVTYNALITAAMQDNDLQKAEVFIDEMINKGFKPNPELRKEIDQLRACPRLT